MTDVHIEIRRATTADAQDILECLAAAFLPYRDSYTPGAYRDTVLSRETIPTRLESMSVLVAEHRHEGIVGTIAFAVVEGTEGHLRGMAVLPSPQGKGLAAQLLEAAEQGLRELGCERVTLDTTQPLSLAIRFYLDHGYAATGLVRDFFGMPLAEYAKKLT